MAEPQPETLSDNMYTALDIVGQTQLAHVGGYRDKVRLGVAMGRGGQNVRIGGMKHYVAEILQSGSKSPLLAHVLDDEVSIVIFEVMKHYGYSVVPSIFLTFL